MVGTIVNINGIPVYDAVITDGETGMFKISLVDDPAVMSNFLAFDSTRKPMNYAVTDAEKRLVRGCIMRCDFPIYRYDPRMGEYYVIYHADAIRTMAEKYLSEGRCNNVNLMHEEGSDVDGVQMVQYFIKGEGVSVEGFDDCADGSLFGEFHIVNDDVWEAVKAGTYKGFSLEGVFDLVPERNESKVASIVDILDGKFSKLLNKYSMTKVDRFKAFLAKVFQEMGSITTDKGILAYDGIEDLAVGDAVYIEDENGERTPAADGEYTTADSQVIVVADGKVAEIKDAEPAPAPADPTAETFAEVATDNGTLLYEGELAVGVAVFVADEGGNNVPAPDGDYTTEDGKVIVVAEGVVVEIKDAEPTPNPADEEMAALHAENASLRDQVAQLTAEVEKFKATSAAKPAHEAAKQTFANAKTGNKGLDNLARIASAK